VCVCEREIVSKSYRIRMSELLRASQGGRDTQIEIEREETEK